MRWIASVSVVILALALIGWLLAGQSLGPAAGLLPLLGGFEPSWVFDVGGFALLGLLIWGLARIFARTSPEDTRRPGDEYEMLSDEPPDDRMNGGPEDQWSNGR